MSKHHPDNERIKRKYLTYLEEANRMASSSVDQVAAAIALFEQGTGCRDFKQFHLEQARKFKRQLQEMKNSSTGKPLATATIHSRLMALKAFFKWLAGQPGYKSKITYSDADYFNTSANDARIAGASRQRPVPSIEQILHALLAMPIETILQRRDRAVFAFALLSGARDDAIASLSLRHINLARRTVDQDARTVRTKARKSFVSGFFPVGAEFEQIVADWINELTDTQLFGPDDPLFPSTRVGLGPSGHFEALGLDRQHWKDASAIRRIFKTAFESAGLPYFNPHSFRSTLALLGERICRTTEDFKSWSQNLGHEQVLTTLTSYGAVSAHRQSQIMNELWTQQAAPDKSKTGEPDAETVAQVVAYLRSLAS
ncbi:site-specific integrase [Devosia neptuniae]|jgi:integrase|uniref:tyrosine-type recombinase/integrase n=1 Tax=Devosia TaxID=46913 RepID=UPI0022B05B01|nr:site-specific integrase [Devosia neptuniae]MCZ4347328.1 site-specific integrase [Devosia neptuniae]|tara:strand:+ start:1950 stop:3062 length:1113 start_codon:yes stop_codon:yes gene_type:complete